MKLYFSYGSNMSRARLEVRTGTVLPHGRATLDGYQHDFTHRGADGSGKGNIVVAEGTQVHGVLYTLTLAQVDALHVYENGYDLIQVDVAVLRRGETVSAYTYASRSPRSGLRPLASYFDHYMRGMLENDFPEDYIETLRKQSGL